MKLIEFLEDRFSGFESNKHIRYGLYYVDQDKVVTAYRMVFHWLHNAQSLPNPKMSLVCRFLDIHNIGHLLIRAGKYNKDEIHISSSGLVFRRLSLKKRVMFCNDVVVVY